MSADYQNGKFDSGAIVRHMNDTLSSDAVVIRCCHFNFSITKYGQSQCLTTMSVSNWLIMLFVYSAV